MENLFTILLGLALVGLSTQVLQWDDECGMSPYEDAGRDQDSMPDIVNGWDARPGEFPWTAGLKSFGSHICGSVIISDRWLLTAAHCTGGSPGQYSVMVGQHDRNDGNGIEVDIEDYINHEDYNTQGELENDIALLYTAEAMPVGEAVMPACKPDGDYGSEYAHASGWGHTSQGGSLAITLQYTNNPVVDQQPCIDCFPGGWIWPGMLCWGFCGENTRSTCNGDSGGPLVVRNPSDTFDLIGMTSWNLGGCVSEYPKVFTNASYFTDWVDSHVDF